MKAPRFDEKTVLKRLESLGRRIAEQVLKEERPRMVIPVRSLSNTIWDPERKMLLLGPRKAKREFFDLNEAKKFMQTLLMLSILVKARREGDYPTIRDLYYFGKHTLEFRDHLGRLIREETWDEQKESNSVLQDIEVMTGLLREHMGVMHDAKGKMVGRIIVRSGRDTIDCSRMGDGAYAIPPNPDELEILELDAEYVLIVEKDAIFNRLNKERYWEEKKCILITGKGQPDRSTRRMIRRLWEEYNLPVYVLTDSVPPNEIIVLRDRSTGRVIVKPIEEAIGKYFDNSKKRERVVATSFETLAYNPFTGRIEWTPIGYFYRHLIDDELLIIKTRGSGNIVVTKGHSLFVFRDGKVRVVRGDEIKPGDYILVAEKLRVNFRDKYQRIIVGKVLLEKGWRERKRTKVVLIGDRIKVADLREIANGEASKYKYVKLSSSKWLIPNVLTVDEDLAWLLGIFTAEGCGSKKRYLTFNLSRNEENIAKRVAEILKEKFNIDPYILKNEKEIRVIVPSRIVYEVFDWLGALGTARSKRIPDVIFNSPKSVVLSYLRGLIEGDGHVDSDGNIIYSTRSKTLSKQVYLLLLMVGTLPSVTVNGDDYVIRIGASRHNTVLEIYGTLTLGIMSRYKAGNITHVIPLNRNIRKLMIQLMNKGLLAYSSATKGSSKATLLKLYNNIGQLPSDYEKIVLGDVVVTEVKEIERRKYRGFVYDIAVPEYESFIGGHGIVYHNSDPYGFYIYSVYKSGSISLSYESERLATPGAKFVGIAPSDIDRYKIPPQAIIRAKDTDLKRAKELLKYPWFKSKAWEKELKLFLSTKRKVEIEALSVHGFKFLSQTYLPEKITSGAWIE